MTIVVVKISKLMAANSDGEICRIDIENDILFMNDDRIQFVLLKLNMYYAVSVFWSGVHVKLPPVNTGAAGAADISVSPVASTAASPLPGVQVRFPV